MNAYLKGLFFECSKSEIKKHRGDPMVFANPYVERIILSHKPLCHKGCFGIIKIFLKKSKKSKIRNKSKFGHMIKTDGISICILFVLLENDKPMSKAKGKKLKGLLDINYIENIKNINEMNKKFVLADPGKIILYIVVVKIMMEN